MTSRAQDLRDAAEAARRAAEAGEDAYDAEDHEAMEQAEERATEAVEAVRAAAREAGIPDWLDLVLEHAVEATYEAAWAGAVEAVDAWAARTEAGRHG